MIYNLYSYLKTNFPNETFFSNDASGINPSQTPPDRYTLMTEFGGVPEPIKYNKTLIKPSTIQFISRDIDSVLARALAYSIFDFLHGKTVIILPAITVNLVNYPAIEIYQISANAIPQSLGFDSEGRSEWVVNYRFYFEH